MIIVGDLVEFDDGERLAVGYVYARTTLTLSVLGVLCEFPPRHPPQAYRWLVAARDCRVIGLRRDSAGAVAAGEPSANADGQRSNKRGS